MSDIDVQHEAASQPRTAAKVFCWLASLIIAGWLLVHVAGGRHHAEHHGGHHDAHHVEADHAHETDLEVIEDHSTHEPTAPPLWGLGIIPFIIILGSIAVLPLLKSTEHWWESNLSRYLVALVVGLSTIVYYWLTHGPGAIGGVLDHAILIEYIPFIVLLFSLYVISGGIQLVGDLPATPRTNVTYIAVGALIASFIGTTGASMLLIRPILRTNRQRKYKVHTIVMFIFLVSNIGGALLPIGDPPLFLGYLSGVPFFWTLGLWPQWLATNLVLLVIYWVWDTVMYRRESEAATAFDGVDVEPLRLRGSLNLLWLLCVILCVAFVNPDNPLPGTDWYPFEFFRELIMLALVGLSLILTRRSVREGNQFNYHAILEVAALFIGIFIAMQVPIEVLKAHGAAITSELNQPWMYFWMTGILSSVLDNAPTYLVFFNLAQTGAVPEGTELVQLGGGGEIPVHLLVAISLGSVFMGAMTYIGNGPNFMVKAIAEHGGVRMPSFIGYVFKYSLPVLVPVFIVMVLVFMIL
ncbi:MAG: sodium:proton antiporter [Phycisphaerae bacterium]|nr:sodium:proton antiporter [Phycisphaerae bacterium]|tara:strand:+ start:9102 stop:10670 length:1569 start_codon:yes stop_codon:yes gene_type:complete